MWCEAGNLLIALPESAAAAVCTPFTAVYLLTIECARALSVPSKLNRRRRGEVVFLVFALFPSV